MNLLLSLGKIVLFLGVRICKLFAIEKFSMSIPFNEYQIFSL